MPVKTLKIFLLDKIIQFAIPVQNSPQKANVTLEK